MCTARPMRPTVARGFHVELREGGIAVGRNRVARLMRTAGLVAHIPRRFQRTTDSNHDLPVAENVLNRDFSASAPNRAWVTTSPTCGRGRAGCTSR